MGTYARSPAGALLRQWKYEGVDEARAFFMDAVRTHLRDDRAWYAAFLEGAVLVPVPCDPFRRATRGFDQSEIIARTIAEEFPGTRVARVLRRTALKKAQAGLDDHAARRTNARGTFGIRRGNKAPERAVLIDDVATSGATLDACAMTLKRAGSVQVRALTILKG
jgi:predicted amidophosphoribosyltransferase